MNEAKTCSLLKLVNTAKNCSKAGERFCFILGAGASVSSGIPSGATMAAKWLDDLKELEPNETKKWMAKNTVDEDNIGRSYSKLYERRFCTHPRAGYIWLQDVMKDAAPALGYYHLAKILAADKTSTNLVITTNFDSLTEDAIFMYTKKKPQVVTHELLAQYTNFLDNRPVIAKVHRDLMLCPQNLESEISQFDQAWEPVLTEALGIYSPIVIGYGGNDGSLMGLLKKVVKRNGTKKPIYWCYRHGDLPKSEILKLLNDCGGFLVPITDFDTAMYLFGMEFSHDFSKDHLQRWYSQETVYQYICNRNKINSTLKKKKACEALSDDEDAVLGSISESLKKEIEKFTEQIAKKPQDERLYFYRGSNYEFVDDYDKALEDITRAIEFEPDNALYLRNRGVIYMHFNQFDEADADLSKAIYLKPNNADYYNRRGINRCRHKEYEKAIADHEKAIELDPEHARSYAWLSYALYKKTGATNEAFKALEKAMALDKTEAFCYAYRGLINLKEAKRNGNKHIPEVREDFDRAEYYEKYYRLFERNTDLAEYYLHIGEVDRAYGYLEKALSQNEQYGRAWYYRAKYHEAKGEAKEVEPFIAKAKEYGFYPDDDD